MREKNDHRMCTSNLILLVFYTRVLGARVTQCRTRAQYVHIRISHVLAAVVNSSLDAPEVPLTWPASELQVTKSPTLNFAAMPGCPWLSPLHLRLERCVSFEHADEQKPRSHAVSSACSGTRLSTKKLLRSRSSPTGCQSSQLPARRCAPAAARSRNPAPGSPK
jgi:hypothetical protein